MGPHRASPQVPFHVPRARRRFLVSVQGARGKLGSRKPVSNPHSQPEAVCVHPAQLSLSINELSEPDSWANSLIIVSVLCLEIMAMCLLLLTSTCLPAGAQLR